MATPQASGFPPAGPPRVTRSRAGGIMLALGGAATLVCVFVLPWERFLDQGYTLWEIRQELAQAQAAGVLTTGDGLIYQVPFFAALAAGASALLAGILAAAVGARATNVIATLAGLFASFLAIFAPVFYFFRGPWDVDDLDFFFSRVAGVAFYLTIALSVFLFVAAVVAFVGVFRAGRKARPAVSAYPAQPQQSGYPQSGYQQSGYQQPGYQQPAYEQPAYHQQSEHQDPSYQQPGGYPQPSGAQPYSPQQPAQPYPPQQQQQQPPPYQ